MPRPVLVCIAGGSASGKSTIARALIERLDGLSTAIVNVDEYFRDWTVDDELRTANRPESVLWPALLSAVDCLLAGGEIEAPAPGTRARSRGVALRKVHVSDLVIVEGLMALWHDDLRAKADLAVYVDVPDDERLLRRISRDIVSRGATVESAVAWYRYDVRPHFERFTEPTKWRADIVVPNVAPDGKPREQSLAALEAAVRALIAGRS